MPLSAGVDVGGTKFLGVLVDDDGAVVQEIRRPTPRGGDAIVAQLADVVSELADGADGADEVATVGIGLPGLITRAGVIVASPNLPGVTDLDVAHRVGSLLGRPVIAGNDATCATFAEWRVGAGRGVDDLVMVTLGTGIGGGAVAGGRLLVGANGFAGEFGHVVVDPDGPPCPCGRRGCWERYASGSGIAHLARIAAIGRRMDAVVERAGGDAHDVRGEHVHAAARDGDAGALAVVDEFTRWVALGLANLTNVFDPAAFVLGGGLATGADLYLEPITRWFGELLYAPDLRPHPTLTFAELGERAGAIGAALLGRDAER